MKFTTGRWILLIAAGLIIHAKCDQDRWEKLKAQYEENVRIASQYPFRDFEKAAQSGDLAAVEHFLDQGVPADLPLPWPRESFDGIPPTERALHHATSESHIEVVRLLLDRGADPNGLAGEGRYTPLHVTHDLEIAKLLISRGADVNARDAWGSQPIHSKSDAGDITKLLIARGADPLAKGEHEFQAIHGAAGSGTAADVGFFLDLKAKVDAAIHDKEGHSSWNGWHPLHFAANREDMDEALKVTELLIQKGADLNAVTAEGDTPLHLSKNAVMTRLLLAHAAKPDFMSTGIIKKQPIHHFAGQGDVDSIKLLLDRGVDIESRSAEEDERITPLDIAVFSGKTEAVKFLLERGAKATERTMKNALYFETSPIEIIRMLHQHGVIVTAEMFLKHHPANCVRLLPFLNQATKDELLAHSAQHIAEAAGSPYQREADGSLGTILALVSLGAKTDQPWEGLRPIHHAVTSGKPAVVEYFLTNGQTIDAKGTLNKDDFDPPLVITQCQPIHLAFFDPEMISFLVAKGAKIDAETGEGWQPIHLAAAHGNPAWMEAVIKAGGDPKAKTRDGKTPLRIAEWFENEEIVEFLKGL
jgi:ankyrin repeat protein